MQARAFCWFYPSDKNLHLLQNFLGVTVFIILNISHIQSRLPHLGTHTFIYLLAHRSLSHAWKHPGTCCTHIIASQRTISSSWQSFSRVPWLFPRVLAPLPVGRSREHSTKSTGTEAERVHGVCVLIKMLYRSCGEASEKAGSADVSSPLD